VEALVGGGDVGVKLLQVRLQLLEPAFTVVVVSQC
jgi:hypothetical protein